MKLWLMNQDDFRRLLAGGQSKEQPSRAIQRGGLRWGGGGQRVTTFQRDQGRVSKLIESVRQTKSETKDKREKKVRNEKEPKSTTTTSLFPSGYRDRAKERQKQTSEQSRAYALQEAQLVNLREAVQRGDITQEDFVLQTKRLGGDFEHAGLVRGLDRVLLERIRRGEQVVQNDVGTEEKKAQDVSDGLCDTSSMVSGTVPEKLLNKEGSMARQGVINAVPDAVPESAPDLDALYVQGLERKKEKQAEESTKEILTSRSLTKTIAPIQCQSEPSAKTDHLPLDDEDDLIFDDVGSSYDPLESLDEKSNACLMKSQKNDSFNDTRTCALPVEPSTSRTSSVTSKGGKRDYFSTTLNATSGGASTLEQEHHLVDAGSLTRETILKEDKQLLGALKKISAFKQQDESQSETSVHPKQKVTNMGFGLWLGEAYDDLEMDDVPIDDDDDDRDRRSKRTKITNTKQHKMGVAT